jgi:RHS repeat-associated protein
VRRTRNWVDDRYFLWDGDHLIAEIDANSQRIAEYVYAPGVDNPVAIVTGPTSIAATRYFQEDELGNVVGVFNTGVAQTLRYDVRGRLDQITGTLADTNRLRWKGLTWEGDVAQLYYVRSRWYDPETGRFLTEDPIGLSGGPNVYVFGGNDPINMADPWGLDPCTEEELKDGHITTGDDCKAPATLKPVMVTEDPLKKDSGPKYGSGVPSGRGSGPLQGGDGPGGWSSPRGYQAPPQRTANQCFSETTAPVRNVLRGAGSRAAVIIGAVVGGGYVLRSQGQALVRGAFDAGKAGAFLFRNGVASSIRGPALAAIGGGVLTGAGVGGAVALIGLGGYSAIIAGMCTLNPN